MALHQSRSICVDSQQGPFRKKKKEITSADLAFLLSPVADAIFTTSLREEVNRLDAKGNPESDPALPEAKPPENARA